MNFLDRFIELRPFAYHVTRAANLERLASISMLFPAADLIKRSRQAALLRLRRTEPRRIIVDGQMFVLQDQKPLVFANAELHRDWGEGDFVEFLNHHVFFWPGMDSGPSRHGARLLDHYQKDSPAVLRVGTAQLIDANANLDPLFCAFNSGAPRMQRGRRATRGPDLFVPAAAFARSPGKAVELVFRGAVTLPHDAEYRTVDGKWERLRPAV